MLGVTGNLVDRVKRTFSDCYGRWSGAGKCVTILCAYQVVQHCSQSRSTTAYSQQQTLFRLAGEDRPNQRKLFIRDPKTQVSQLRKTGSAIIIISDFNETIGLRAKGMAEVLRAGNLVDSFSYRHGLNREGPMYACTTGLFDPENTALAHPSCQHINADCPKHVAMYIASLHQYLQAHNILQRIDDLLKSTPNVPAAESIDRDVARAMLHAELRCKSFRRLPWMKDVHQAMTVLNILKRQLTQLLTNRSMQRQIDNRQKQLSRPIPLSNSISATKKAL